VRRSFTVDGNDSPGHVKVDLKCEINGDGPQTHFRIDSGSPFKGNEESLFKNGCIGWEEGPWNECQVESGCGDGTQTREVKCSSENGGCNGEKPEESKKCTDKTKCADWKVEEWSACVPACGKGVKSRKVECPKNAQCYPGDKPPEEEACDEDPCKWDVTQFGDCNCTTKAKSREVSCQGGEDKLCEGEKPASTEECNVIELKMHNCISDKDKSGVDEDNASQHYSTGFVLASVLIFQILSF